MLQVQAWAHTDVGRQRSHNEDNYIVSQELGLFGVADGMGGHAAGEVASEQALNSLCEAIAERINELRLLAGENPEKHRKKIISIMESAVQHSAKSVYTLSQSKASSRGMGTTMSVILTLGNKGIVAHVGDSRVFLLRQGELKQLTEDHSLVNEQLRLGLITEEEAERSPYKNVITRAVGASESVEPDIVVVDLQEGDRFLLCSDGLHGYFENVELRPFLGEENPAPIAQKLTDLANHRGGKDNITAIVLSVQSEDSKRQGSSSLASTSEKLPVTQPEFTEPPSARTEITLRMDALQAIPLFEHMTYDELVHVMSITFLKSYQDSEIIFKEGSKGDLLYILLGGKVGLFARGKRLETLEAGRHFGELAVVERAPRDSTAIAEDNETQLLTVKRKSLLAMLRKNQGLAVKLLWGLMKGMAPRLRHTRSQLVQLLEQGD